MTDKAATWLFYKFDLYMSEQSLLASLTRKHGLGLSMVFVKILYAAVSFGCFLLTAEMFSIGDFKTYGSEWIKKLKLEDNLATEEKDKLFPKMVACEVKRWGASGNVHKWAISSSLAFFFHFCSSVDLKVGKLFSYFKVLLYLGRPTKVRHYPLLGNFRSRSWLPVIGLNKHMFSTLSCLLHVI